MHTGELAVKSSPRGRRSGCEGVSYTSMSDRPSKWFFRQPVSDGADVRLFAFPSAGYGAAMYREWPARLSANVDLVAIQAPGRANRLGEPPLATFPELVGALLPEMLKALDLPYALFGHSMGAVFAAEIAAAIMKAGGPPPIHLFLSARQPPSVPSPVEPLSHLDDDAFVHELNLRYGAVAEEILREPEVLALLLPTLRADIAALEAIEGAPARRLPAPITTFGGESDRIVPGALLDGWREWTADRFERRMFPGGHFYLEAEQARLVSEIDAALAGARVSELDR